MLPSHGISIAELTQINHFFQDKKIHIFFTFYHHFLLRMKLSLINHASKRVVVVGGGSAGISTAARLSKSRDIDVTLVDGSKNHYYQPIWTLVGGGLYNFSDSEVGF